MFYGLSQSWDHIPPWTNQVFEVEILWWRNFSITTDISSLNKKTYVSIHHHIFSRNFINSSSMSYLSSIGSILHSPPSFIPFQNPPYYTSKLFILLIKQPIIWSMSIFEHIHIFPSLQISQITLCLVELSPKGTYRKLHKHCYLHYYKKLHETPYAKWYRNL
jgi:hypothetical protein